MANRARAVTKTRERAPASQGPKDNRSSPSHRKTSSRDTGRRRSKTPANPRERFEHYVGLARAAALADDKIESEYYYQHAEHYLRLLNRKAMGHEASQCGGS